MMFNRDWWNEHGNWLRFDTFADWLVSGTVLIVAGLVSLGVALTILILFFHLLTWLWASTGVIS